MIFQIVLTLMLGGIALYALLEFRRSRVVGVLSMLAALAGMYFAWSPEHATALAAFVGVGRGVDLILYTWVVISLLVILNLHFKLQVQLELITALARRIAIEHPEHETVGKPATRTARYVAPELVHAPPTQPELRRTN